MHQLTLTPSATDAGLTMSSREIAELLELRPDSVKRSIERLVERGTIVHPPLVDEPGADSMGRPRITQVYLLDKRSTYIVVAQLSPEFTARVIDRWQELEAKAVAPALPNFGNPAEAARAWAIQFERAEQEALKAIESSKALALAAPKAQALDTLVHDRKEDIKPPLYPGSFWQTAAAS